MTPCPACAAPLDPPVYRTGPVPVHSCLMLDGAAAAAAFPTGEVHLAPCPACGLVVNTAFDPRWSAYAPEYEDQQSFSPRFNGFAADLARGLIARHGLDGGQVVEIGCSKGDFLHLLAELGDMRGTGIDPSALPGRLPPPRRGSLRLIPEYYTDAHLDLPADLLCARHMLEHVGPVAEMLGRMHRHLAANPGAVLCIEVPDATRIWQTGAFEDIYYEHCSYFTAGSLARALRRAGFGLLELRREYNGQYLVAEAVADPARDRPAPLAEPARETTRAIAGLATRAAAQITGWQGWLRGAARRGEPVAIWGSGSKCVAFLRAMGPEAARAVTTLVDINPHRAGHFAPGMALPVSRPEDLTRSPPARVIAMNPIYTAEITARLARLGLSLPVQALGTPPA
ncbi:class I SAM-dependent methyltransferase [Pseudooceanicola aestuarii]|uniref:class I SAM-dependent methyltransferase n=1 Tax=Pseudooceanicola aestuarii TaxID=2697319 RepID=UPI0013D5BA98|nr:class I SAM-dependent methyltransferase [Pseudooceanicola aestuarii]